MSHSPRLLVFLSLSTACSSFGLCLWGGISLQWYQNSSELPSQRTLCGISQSSVNEPLRTNRNSNRNNIGQWPGKLFISTMELFLVHRMLKIKCNTNRTYSLNGHNVDGHIIFLWRKTFTYNVISEIDTSIFSFSTGCLQHIISKILKIFCLSNWAK